MEYIPAASEGQQSVLNDQPLELRGQLTSLTPNTRPDSVPSQYSQAELKRLAWHQADALWHEFISACVMADLRRQCAEDCGTQLCAYYYLRVYHKSCFCQFSAIVARWQELQGCF